MKNIRKKLYQILVFVLLQCCTISIVAQNIHQLSEKYHLHTDRDYYVAGEDIQFKAYFVNKRQPNQKQISTVLYLNLVDSSGNAVEGKKFIVENNVAYGTFKIPENCKSGFYKVYAYSKWQRNFGVENFSQKKIFVLNSKNGISYKKNKVRKNPTLKFFPEDGSLCINTKNKIVFYAKDKFNKALDIEGIIIDGKGRIITAVKTSKNKIGEFFLSPENGTLYKLITKIGNDSLSFNLPKPEVKAHYFTLDNTNGAAIALKYTDLTGKNENLDCTIEVRHNGLTYQKNRFIFSNNQNSYQLPGQQLIEGINHIICKDRDNKIVFSQFFNIQRNQSIKFDLSTNKTTYGCREKVDLDIEPVLSSSLSGSVNLSVSVSKLTNKVENVNFTDFRHQDFITEFGSEYNNTEEFNQDFNNYLLTKANLSQIDNKQLFLPDLKGHYLSGTVKRKDGKPLISSVQMFLTVLDSCQTLSVFNTDKNGRFMYVPGNTGNNELILQINDVSSEYELHLDNEFIDKFPGFFYDLSVLAPSTKDYLKELMFNYQIQKQFEEVTDNQKLIDSTASFFYGKPDSSYLLAKYIDLPTLEEVFNNIIINVIVKKSKKKYDIKVYDFNSKQLVLPTLLLVDGMPFVDVEAFLKIHPSKVERIDIIETNFMVGSAFFGGIVNLISKKHDFLEVKLPNSSQIIDYSAPAIGQDTNYDISNYSKLKNQPDLRNTLFWNPNLSVATNNSSKLSFFTSDEVGKYIIKVNGISEDGQSGSGCYVFEVK